MEINSTQHTKTRANTKQLFNQTLRVLTLIVIVVKKNTNTNQQKK